MSVPAEIFRAYDVRGRAQDQLTPRAAYLVGRAFARLALKRRLEKRAVVGRDVRHSSPALLEAVKAGLRAEGFTVFDGGELITPALYYACHHWEIPAGAMVTGSHNPPDENGLKLVLGPGTIHGEEIKELHRLTVEMEKGGDCLPELSGEVKKLDVRRAYLDMLAEKIRLGPKPLKAVVDCGSGAAGYFAPHIFERWGCRVVPLYCTPDPDFPYHHPDPVKPANLADLRRAVGEEKADLGVAFDGDGDRLGVVDEKGEIVWGDKLMILFWREILPHHPGTPAIVEVKCSQALVEEIQRLGGRPVFYRTGHSLIKAKMRELGAVFTGEMSGHMFFADEYFGFDDALYAAGRLLRILSSTGRPLSDLLADAPVYYSTAETRISCPDHSKFAVVERLRQHFREHCRVIDVDGVRVLFGDGWGLVRASNTQPVLVARCEARTPAGLQRICGIVKEALRRYPEVGDFEWEY